MQGKPAEAIAALRRAIEISPDLHDAHFTLGIALASLGQTRDAVASFRQAILLKPDLAEAQNNIRIEQGKEGALAALRDAVRNLPRPVAKPAELVVKVAGNEGSDKPPADRIAGFRVDPALPITSVAASHASQIELLTRRSPS